MDAGLIRGRFLDEAQRLAGGVLQTLGDTGLPLLKQAAGVVTRRVPIPQPLLLVGAGAALRLAHTVAGFGHRRLLVVTDADIVRLKLIAPFLAALDAARAPHVLFDAVTADAPIPVIERGVALMLAEGCDAIVAFGGGSVIDAAKVIGLAAANRRPPRDLAGYFRGLHGPAPIYAVPTTAGTGSEVTVAAVISDPEAGRKRIVADTRLVPDIAALDPTLMTGLPPQVTAATGMDALTHAIEAYLSAWASAASDRWALAAVRAIWQHLPTAVEQGGDLRAREQMALAASFAGLAFTRANVGNVHALAHQLGARCHVPHGLANALLLPAVLRFGLESTAPRLAALARAVQTPGCDADDDAVAAAGFIDAVQALSDRIGIPRTLAALDERDIPALAEAACSEADLNYPVPRRMSREDAAALLRGLLVAPGREAGRQGSRSPRVPRAPQRSRAARATPATPATPAARAARPRKGAGGAGA